MLEMDIVSMMIKKIGRGGENLGGKQDDDARSFVFTIHSSVRKKTKCVPGTILGLGQNRHPGFRHQIHDVGTATRFLYNLT